MKLALLGTGMIVTEVLPVLTTIEGIELEAIMSTPRSLDKAEALAKQYGLSQAYPRTGEEMFFTSPLPEDMTNLIDKWRNYISNREEL